VCAYVSSLSSEWVDGHQSRESLRRVPSNVYGDISARFDV